MKLKQRKGPQVAFTSGLIALALSLATFASGCGTDEEWSSSGAGPEIDTKTGALTSSPEPVKMDDDLVAMPPPANGIERVQGAVTSGDGSGGSSGSTPTKSGDPKVFYLFYANGEPLPPTDADACGGLTAPKFNCTFAPTLAECQRQIQAYLDQWYADLNIIFTLTRPTSGKFYTEVVSSGGGAWCNVSSKVAGVAPFLCKDLQGGVAYTFLGGTSAKQTAIIIAQEQAHLLGLEHTTSTHDIMYPSICSDCDDGFNDTELPTDGDRCDRPTQNSYEMMKQQLGLWGGGPKPSAFGCANDQVPPTLQIMEPADGATVKADFSLRVNAKDDCGLASVDVKIMPQSLKATSYAAPFEWDLTNISGQQTLTVTAIDNSGHVTQKNVTVTAPMAANSANAMSGMAGCTVGNSAFGLAGVLPAIAALFIFARRRRAPVRRRPVTGSLAMSRAPAEDPLGGE